MIWVLTPKTGRPGHVEPSEIAEAAPTAGLSQTSNVTVSDGWAGSRLVAPKAVQVPALTHRQAHHVPCVAPCG